MLGSYTKQHFELMEKIRAEKDHDTLLALCEIDASIADKFKSEWQAQFPNDLRLPRYPAFQKLAIIHEKQGNYRAAIAICKKAIALGFDYDGTKNGMKGRIARLEKKLELE